MIPNDNFGLNVVLSFIGGAEKRIVRYVGGPSNLTTVGPFRYGTGQLSVQNIVGGFGIVVASVTRAQKNFSALNIFPNKYWRVASIVVTFMRLMLKLKVSTIT